MMMGMPAISSFRANWSSPDAPLSHDLTRDQRSRRAIPGDRNATQATYRN